MTEMVTKTAKRLSSMELAQLIKNLKPGEIFTVRKATERGVASGIAKNFRNAGVIDFVVSSHKTVSGEFVFFIVPDGK